MLHLYVLGCIWCPSCLTTKNAELYSDALGMLQKYQPVLCKGQLYKSFAIHVLYRLKSVISKVQKLALVYFNQTHVAGACVAFTEMLGCDSTETRVHLEAAWLLQQHWCSQLEGPVDQRKQQESRLARQVSHMLLSCLRAKQSQAAREVVTLLEAAIYWQLDKHRIKL